MAIRKNPNARAAGRDEKPEITEMFPPSEGVTSPQDQELEENDAEGVIDAADHVDKPEEPAKAETNKPEKPAKAKPRKTPADVLDLSSLFTDTGQGDPLTDTVISEIPVGKPKDFFRLHPDPAYRQRCHVYVHKPEDQLEEQYYIVPQPMLDKVPEAVPCLLATCIYRDGSLRIWPLKLPPEGGKDYDAWKSARAAAKKALTQWVRLRWVRGKYDTREAKPGYAPDPDLKKIPPYDKIITLAFGKGGVMHDETHPIYHDQILGGAKEADDDLDL
jgi:hypothetical protein